MRLGFAEILSTPKEYKLPSCQETPFCNRNIHLQNEFKATAFGESDFYYSLDESSIKIDDLKGSVQAKLNLACSDSTDEISPELDLTLWFYQNGIMRAFLEEPASGRFRISDDSLPVVEE
jgi:hypothetical protein